MSALIVKDEANVKKAHEIMQDLSLTEEEAMAQIEELRKEDPGAVDAAVGDIFSLVTGGPPIEPEQPAQPNES